MPTQENIILREELVASHVDQWFGLIDICKTSTDKKFIKNSIDIYAKTWSRLNYWEQGEISARIHERYNERKDQ